MKHIDSMRAECATLGLWSLAGPVLRRVMARFDGGQPTALKHLIEEN